MHIRYSTCTEGEMIPWKEYVHKDYWIKHSHTEHVYIYILLSSYLLHVHIHVCKCIFRYMYVHEKSLI